MYSSDESDSYTQKTPFRAENVGSFLRPAPLYARRKEMDDRPTSFDLKPLEDKAIEQVVKLQKNLGIKTVTDGELRRFLPSKS